VGDNLKVAEQRAETVDGQSVVGALGAGLAIGGATMEARASRQFIFPPIRSMSIRPNLASSTTA